MFLIRNAQIEDYDEIKKLMQQVQDLHFNNRCDIYKNNKVFAQEKFEEIIASNKTNILVATDKEKIVGCLLYSIKTQKEDDYIYERKYLYIDTLVVDINMRNNGIGKKIYSEAKRIALENNCKSIDLNVWSFNKSAINFYEAQGMTIKSLKYEENLL